MKPQTRTQMVAIGRAVIEAIKAAKPTPDNSSGDNLALVGEELCAALLYTAGCLVVTVPPGIKTDFTGIGDNE